MKLGPILILAVLCSASVAGGDVAMAKTALSYNLAASHPWMPLFWGGFTSFSPGTGNSLSIALQSDATPEDRLTIRAGNGVSISANTVAINGLNLVWSGPVQGPSATLSVTLNNLVTPAHLQQLLTRVYFASTADPASTAGASRAIALSVRGAPAASLTISLVNGNVAPMALFGEINASQSASGAVTLIEAWDDTKTDAELFFFPASSTVGAFGTGTGVAFTPSPLVPVNNTPSFSAPTLGTMRFQVASGYVGTPAWNDVKLLVGEAASPVPSPTWPVTVNIVDDTTVLSVAGPPILFVSMLRPTVNSPFSDPSPETDLVVNGVTGDVPSSIVAHPLFPTLLPNAAQVVLVTRPTGNRFHVAIDRAKLAEGVSEGTRMVGWVVVLTPADGQPIRIPMLAMLRWTPRAPG